MNWKIRGNYKQKKREGYSLLNNNSQFFPTLPGLTFDFKKDGSIVCQGTSSSTWNRKRNAGNIYNVESGTYTLYLKVVGSCPNAILNIALEDTDMKTIVSSRVGVSDSLLIKAGTFNYDGITEIKYTSILLEGIRTNTDYDCVFYPMLLKGTYAEDVKYEQFGASPSLEFPSEIETVSGDVKVKAVNKQLFNKNNYQKFIGGMWSEKLWANNDNRCVYIQAEENTSYSISRIAGARFTVAFVDELPDGEKGATLYDAQSSDGTKIIITNTNHKYLFVYYYTTIVAEDELAILNSLQIEKGKTVTEYEEHKSQVITMPIQQEMLNGDYIADVEHHEWRKLVLTGNENFVQAQNANKLNYFYLGSNSVKIRGKIISNMLKNIENGTIWNKTSYDDIVSSSSNSKTINIMLSDTTITTLQQFKEKLKELYNAGTPVIIYYKLVEPIDLELTEEQKTVRDTKLYTYKNITNISLSDELASVDVEYKKDLETEHNKLQNEIDEIKQLISTTETSALLLDNLQKDVEMEAE